MHDPNPLTAPPRRAALGARRRIELVALVATIPAFYMELLPVNRVATVALYLAACAATLAVLWGESEHRAGRGGWRGALAARRIGVLLASALLVSALLPAGDAVLVIGVRLFTAALVILRFGESVRPWFWRGGLPHLLAQAVGVLGLCGLGFWWLEPQVQSFGDGLWLAFTTASTVGYGDIVPSTSASRIFAGFVVLLGVSVLSVVTASIAAKLMQTEERRIESEILHDLHRQLRGIRAELAALRAERTTRPDSPAGAGDGASDPGP